MEIREFNLDKQFMVSMTLYSTGAEWKDYLTKEAASLQKVKAVPGFRAGKAPLNVCIKTYGNDLFQAAASTATNAFFMQACAEKELAPVSVPNFMNITADAVELETHVSFTTYPVLEELQYKGLKIEKPVKTVSEAEIDEGVNRYMRQHYYVHEVPREARMEDIVQVDFTGTCNGEGFEYDHSAKSRFTMGSENLFPGLDAELVGHVAGDVIEVSLTMPDDFVRESVAGKTLDLKVHLQGVWARDLLECTDEYCKEQINDPKVNSLADFREKIRSELQNRYDRESETLFQKRTTKALVDKVDCYIPPEMLDTAVKRYVATLKTVAQQDGKTPEQALADEGKTMEDFIKLVTPSARDQVKESIALDYIVSAEKLSIPAEEVENHFRQIAKISKISLDDAKKRDGGPEGYYEKRLNNLAIELVRNNADVNKVEVAELPKE